MRVWGSVEGRLVEVVGEPGEFLIEGLPVERAVPTEHRLRAALVNSGAAHPRVRLRLVPAVEGAGGALDVPLAIAALAFAGGVLGDGEGWIYASGRLGPDGRVRVPGSRVTLRDVARRIGKGG